MIKKISSLKKEITSIFLHTQNIIISSYFNKAFHNIYNLEDVENYRKKLYNFKNYLGSTEGYTYFNDYYVNKMVDLEEKYNLLENGINDTSLYLISKKESKILKFFRYIRKIFIHEKKRELDTF